MHTELVDNRGKPLSITFVYGHPDHSKIDFVWAKLRELKFMSYPSWLCIGDFNQILDHDDKLSFNWSKPQGTDAFQQLIFYLEFYELASIGQKFT